MVANQYSENLENDDLFFFNKNNCIGEGSDKNHTYIMMSSKAMMLKVENNGVLHIDGTYKLIKNRFPVIGNDIIILKSRIYYDGFITHLNESALKLDKSLFKKSSYNKYNYKKYTIDRVDKSWSCRGFLKHAICLHSLAFSHLKNLEWFGQKYTTKSDEFVFRNKNGRPKGRRYKKSLSALNFDED